MKTSMLKILPLALMLSLAYAMPAAASDISVGPLIVDFAPGAQFQDINVSNTGKDKAYVKVVVQKLTNPGQGKNVLTPDTGNPATFGIAVTPQKFALPINQNRTIRVINFNKNLTQDAVYIATISPVASLVAGTATTADGQTASMGMQITVSYKVKIFIRPSNPLVDLKIVRNGKTAVITNHGNTNALLTGFEQCAADGSNCTDLNMINRLYAGNSWTITLPTDAPFQFNESYLNVKKVIKSQ